MIGLICGLYFHHKGNWKQRVEKINEFKAKLNNANFEESKKEDTDPEDKNQIIDNNFEIKSPFNSKLATIMGAKRKESKAKEVEVQDIIKEEEKIEIQRPDFKLKGIVRIGEYQRVNVEFAGEYKHLSKGEVIDGFTLVDISKNSVIFKKGENYFEFKINGSNYTI
jgi:hypothetical protein